MEQIFSIQDKYIWITGASSGLGKYIAAFYASRGAHLVLCARREDRLNHLKDQLIQKYAVDVHSYTLDVNDRSAIKKMFNDLDAKNISIDVLVNNAGISDTKRFLAYDDADWDAIVSTNLKAPWICSQEVVNHMVNHKKTGSIIHITSILSESISLGVSPYCASKAGLRHLTKVMASELARHQVRVNAIAPGYMLTEINQEYLSGEGGQILLKKIPMRRFVEFEDLNGTLLLLASDASRGMTGTEIKIDCGHSCMSIS